jgi:hypothetical protein
MNSKPTKLDLEVREISFSFAEMDGWCDWKIVKDETIENSELDEVDGQDVCLVRQKGDDWYSMSHCP